MSKEKIIRFEKNYLECSCGKIFSDLDEVKHHFNWPPNWKSWGRPKK